MNDPFEKEELTPKFVLWLKYRDPTLAIGTRAGVRWVRREKNGWYAVDMGPWRLTGGEGVLDSTFAGYQPVRGHQPTR